MRENISTFDFMNRLGKHKIFDIDRDYRTGKVEVIEREKPNQAMVNHARVLMRNADTRRLQSESIAHNIVHTGLLNAYGFLSTYYNRISQKNVDLVDPFGAIILSDYDGAESQDDLTVGGNILGWAGKTTTYVGTDAYKGTYTAADSSITDGLRTGSIKYVYDWPRNAANGTIKSIWWNYLSGGESGVLQDLYFPSYWGANYGTWPSMIDCCCDGTYLYAVNNDEFVKKYDLATGLLVGNATTFGTGVKLRGIDWDGTNFWVLNENGDCYKCAIGTFGIITTVGTISSISPINGLAVVNGKIYVSTGTGIYRYDLSGVSEHEYSPTEFGATGFYKIKGNDKYLVVIASKTSGYRFAQLNLDGTVKHVKNANSGSGLSHYMNFTFIRNAQYKTSRVFVGKEQGYQTSYWRWYMLPTPGAHTKLPTAKPKDSTTTMTVEYNFNCDLSHLD